MSRGHHRFEYEVLEGWEQLPEGWSFTEVAGVAVDSKDQVYVFCRGEHPLIVFDKDGHFITAWSEGVFTIVPPRAGKRFRTLVPAFDNDGNGVGGIRLPELEAPLGTYQGWNPRADEFGSPNHLTRFDGSFWAFALTEVEREKNGDPRPSVAARFGTKEDWVAGVTAAARRLVADRILLPEDGQAYVEAAELMAWPPVPVERAPFWQKKHEVESVEVPLM